MSRVIIYSIISVLSLTLCISLATAEETGKGQGVYMNFCSACHASGVAGAPKVGDKEAWAQRINLGMEFLIERAINGYQGESGVMPAKGGNMSLTDEEVSAAVHYMVEQSR